MGRGLAAGQENQGPPHERCSFSGGFHGAKFRPDAAWRQAVVWAGPFWAPAPKLLLAHQTPVRLPEYRYEPAFDQDPCCRRVYGSRILFCRSGPVPLADWLARPRQRRVRPCPKGFRQFKSDGFFVVGESSPARDWPYVQPGPTDAWAGSRAHTFTILFGVKPLPPAGTDTASSGSTCSTRTAICRPSLRIEVNGRPFERQMPAGMADASVQGEPDLGQAAPIHRGVSGVAAARRATTRLTSPLRPAVGCSTTAWPWKRPPASNQRRSQALPRCGPPNQSRRWSSGTAGCFNP